MKNPIAWFEIPVNDMVRAIRFYSGVFDIQLSPMDMGPLKMALFPTQSDSPGPGGALVLHKEFYQPSDQQGVLLYFSCEDIDAVLNKVIDFEGTILVTKKMISPEHGFMALFLDSEGNRMALHSNS